MFQVVPLHTPANPPETYAPIAAEQGSISPLATGLVGLGVGALAGAGYIASRKFSKMSGDESVPGSGPEGGHVTPEAGADKGPEASA